MVSLFQFVMRIKFIRRTVMVEVQVLHYASFQVKVRDGEVSGTLPMSSTVRYYRGKVRCISTR